MEHSLAIFRCARLMTALPSLFKVGLIVSAACALLLLVSCLAYAESPTQCDTAAGFFQKIAGEWVGVCEQTTDGQKADDKYFHVTISKTGENTFESRFEYYRLDPKNGAPVRAGESKVVTTVGADGVACSKITGQGTVMVYESPKMQEHQVTETAKTEGANSLHSQGKGTISVSGMPLGLGKNGKVLGTDSVWTLTDGALCIHQTLKVGFRALIVNKTFSVVADYNAKRGTNVASLMTGKTVSARSSAAFD